MDLLTKFWPSGDPLTVLSAGACWVLMVKMMAVRNLQMKENGGRLFGEYVEDSWPKTCNN